MSVQRQRIRRLFVVPATLAVVAGGVAGGQGIAGAATRASATAGAASVRAADTGGLIGSGTIAGVVRHIGKRTTSTAFPAKGRVYTQGAAMNLTEDGQLTRYAVRSHSSRPQTTARNGTRTLATTNTATSWVPVATPTAVGTTRPGVATSWSGLNAVSNEQTTGFAFEPPDQGMCVGAGHVIELINVSAQVFNTNGTPASPAVDIARFFHVPPIFNPTTQQFGAEVTDPSCLFDAGTQRFFAVSLVLDLDPKTSALTLVNYLRLAVSKTSDPLGGWTFYNIPTTDTGAPNGPAHKDCPCIGDFPQMGTDANGLYVTTNEYPWSSAPGVFGNNFNGAQVYALDKSAMTRGATSVTVVHFNNTHIDDASGAHPGFAIWPARPSGANYPTAAHGSEFFTSSFAAEEAQPKAPTGHTNRIALWQITNTSSLRTGTPALALHGYLLRSESYGVPPLADQKLGPTPLLDCLRVACRGDGGPYTPDVENGLDSSDSRILTSWFVGGQVLAALDTAMQVSGNIQSGVAWFTVRPGGLASYVARQGYLGVTGQNVIYPAIATAPSGSGVMGLTLSGKAFYPSAAYAFYAPYGPAGVVHVAALGKGPQDGFCEYSFFNCAGTETPTPRPRWGDYGAAAWDGRNLYVANEFINQRCSFTQFNADTTCGGTRTYYANFSTRITKLSVASPAS